jgi:hypothetical protein
MQRREDGARSKCEGSYDRFAAPVLHILRRGNAYWTEHREGTHCGVTPQSRGVGLLRLLFRQFHISL